MLFADLEFSRFLPRDLEQRALRIDPEFPAKPRADQDGIVPVIFVIGSGHSCSQPLLANGHRQSGSRRQNAPQVILRESGKCRRAPRALGVRGL